MAKAIVSNINLSDGLELAVQILKFMGIDATSDVKKIKDVMEGRNGENVPKNTLQKAQLLIKDLLDIVPLLRSRETTDKIIAVVKIAALISACLNTSRSNAPAVAGLVLGLLSKFLCFMWKGKEDITKLLAEDLDLEEMRHEIAGVARQFRTFENYLCGLNDYQNLSEFDVSAMLALIKIDEGVKILGVLQSKINLSIVKRDAVQANRAIHYVAFYVRIAALRHAMLGQMYSIVTSKLGKSATTNAINSVIEGESREDEEFLHFLTIPTLDKAMFFALFDLSNFEEIDIFLQSKGLKFQNLNEDLSGNILYLQTKYPNLMGKFRYMKMAWNPWGTVWGSDEDKPTDLENQPLFGFQALSEKDNYFLISNRCNRNMYMKDNRYCAGTYDRPGPEGEWKVIKMECGSFILCPKSRPGDFLYMEDEVFGYVKGLELKTEIEKRGLWKIAKMQNFDYENVNILKGGKVYGMIRLIPRFLMELINLPTIFTSSV